MVTQNDIAQALGLNKTTVSKALRGSSDISEATIERVLLTAKEMGYTKALPRPKGDLSQVIAVLCPEIISHYYSQVTTSLFNQLKNQGYTPAIFITDFREAQEEEFLSYAVRKQAASIIILTESKDITSIAHKALGEASVPLIIMGLNYEAGKFDVVSVNERHGINKAIEHLVNSGRKHIAYIGDQYGEVRHAFITQGILAKNLTPSADYVSTNNLRYEECGYQGMKALFAKKVPIDAVFAEYDTIALGAYRAICEAGLLVPDDIALVGFDNADFCKYLPVTLSTIDNHIEDMCNITLSILRKKINRPDFKVVQTVAILPDFIPRESSEGKKLPE